MRWEVEIRPRNTDLEAQRAAAEIRELGQAEGVGLRSARVYLLEGKLDRPQVERVARELLMDSTVEDYAVSQPGVKGQGTPVNVLLKPGVMDPTAESVQQAIRDMDLPETRVRTARRYYFKPSVSPDRLRALVERVLANDAIETVIAGPLPESAWSAAGSSYTYRLITVPLRALNDDDLMSLSREGQLYLSLAEMQTIQKHFRELGRDPTDVELETLAQTWSEHCSHKTLKGKIDFTSPSGRVFYDNLLKQTIFHATQAIRRRLGKDDWCVSVFEDNAGVVKFDERFHVCFKVETHNHPSAIEPYGGANTGLGGVIRDVMGTGLGGQPICNTDVFCFAPPDYSLLSPLGRGDGGEGTGEQETGRAGGVLPPGVLHPKRVMRGVVAGVRDYGNRMGIPTVNGAICFEERYLGNPLVFCGTVGLIPVGKEHKQPRPGDLIVAVGGRTGRDGIHGATFSSAELTHESEQISGGAVQIGNAITEKKMLDVLLQARDRGLYHAITDCGAGGLSSAVGEMGAEIGAVVHVERAPLKYQGLSYTEIWISESQERMVLAVPPEKWSELQALCQGEDVEATVIGEYKRTGRLRLFYQDQQVADLDMAFLHQGRPPVVRQAEFTVRSSQFAVDGAQFAVPSSQFAKKGQSAGLGSANCELRTANYTEDLLRILSSLNVCSKEWVIRQYDHEVQGGSVIKPLTGRFNDGPSDAAVIAPVLGSTRGVAIGCGINPRYGDLDPYYMAASAIDEAVRNVVAVGADPGRIALLDNFCWGNTDRPETLGSLVRAAEACRDVAIAYGTPFISGKDSLNNEFKAGDLQIAIPPTLLISALGQVPDVRECVTMDLKKPGNLLYLLGHTREEFGGSHFSLVRGVQGGEAPRVDLGLAPKLFRKLHTLIRQGLIQACHDLSEGGLAVALAEMCLAGDLGAEVHLGSFEALSMEAILFSESNSRFLLEAAQEQSAAVEGQLRDLPHARLGVVIQELRLTVATANNSPLIEARVADLREVWQRPLRS